MKKGDNVRVIKGGLMSTGWVGVVVAKRNGKVEVQFPNRANTLKYNEATLEVVANVPKPAPKVQEKVEIVNGMMFEDNVNVILFVNINGELRGFTTRFIGTTEDNKARFSNATYDFKDIVHVFPRNEVVKFERPEHQEMPFWVFGDVKEARIMHVSTAYGGSLTSADGYELLLKWISKDFNSRQITQHEVRRVDGKNMEHEAAKVLFAEKLEDATRRAKKARMSFSVAYITPKGQPKLYNNIGAACHYSMKTFTGELENRDKHQFLFGVQYLGRHYYDGDANEKEAVEAWINWVLNDSPWSQYIITKDVNEVIESGAKIKLDVPANALMCTFYALRYPTEYMPLVKRWYETVKEGLEPTMAYFYAETNQLGGNTRGHHQLLDTYCMNKDALIRFLKHQQGGRVTKNWIGWYRYEHVSVHHGVGVDEPVGETAVQWLKKQDIYGDEERNVGTAFNPKMVKQIDIQKLNALAVQLKA